MKYNDFVIGLRVKMKVDYGTAKVGMQGTVIRLANSGSIGICFDKWMERFHSCHNACPEGHGYYIDPEYLELIGPIDDLDNWI